MTDLNEDFVNLGGELEIGQENLESLNTSIIPATNMNEHQAIILIKELLAEWYSQKQPYAKLHKLKKHIEVLKVYFPFTELLNDSGKDQPGLRSMLKTLLANITKYS